MTTPTERTRAVLRIERLAIEIESYTYTGTDCCDTDRAVVPMDLLRMIVGALRHYPTRHDLERSHEALPDVWGPPDGDV